MNIFNKRKYYSRVAASYAAAILLLFTVFPPQPIIELLSPKVSADPIYFMYVKAGWTSILKL